MTKKKHEELVEEIAKKILSHHVFPRSEPGWDRAVEQAGYIITFILSAFRDGRLDEELGVVGRGTALGFIESDTIIVNKDFADKLHGDESLIALRRPTIELDEPSFIAEIH